jgi:tRNA-guanine family transglycosylase
MFSFDVTKKSKRSRARTGLVTTPHGAIRTPAFIPVATLGVVKGGIDSPDLEKTGSQCQITNTFHFLDLEATKIVKKAGGLHKFFNFNKPIFTDSGGFQVFSLGKGAEFGLGKIGSIFPGTKEVLKKKTGLVTIREDGVQFISPRNGRTVFLTPESSAEAQIALGADFIYLLDICGATVDSREHALRDLERTNRWYARYLAVKIPAHQRTFAIIQGGTFNDLRIASTKAVNELGTFGIAIGGALGATRQEMFKTISLVNEHIDWNRPHHLLGVGDLESIPEIIKLGVDLFDCALPTRIARHGSALTKSGLIDVTRGKMKNVLRPIDASCACPTCQTHTVAMLNILSRGHETLFGRLLTIHNLFFLEKYLQTIRTAIEAGKF